MTFSPNANDGTRSFPEYKPSQYVSVEFEQVMEKVRQHAPGFGQDPEYVTLFGNKAVRYTYYGVNQYTVVVGYFKTDQLPKSLATRAAMQVPEYLVRIKVTRPRCFVQQSVQNAD